MPIYLMCRCGQRFEFAESMAGQHVTCQGCARVMVVPAPPRTTPDVFISYSSHDKAVADAICATLESRSIRCWIAPRDVRPGADWGAAIIEAITNSRIMVLVFSSTANCSPQVTREVERAVSKGKTIIPFRVENVLPTGAMDFFLSATHWLDAFPQPVDAHFRQLIPSVATALNKPHLAQASAAIGPSPAISQGEQSAWSGWQLPGYLRWQRRHVLVAVTGLALLLAAGVGWISWGRSQPDGLSDSSRQSSTETGAESATAGESAEGSSLDNYTQRELYEFLEELLNESRTKYAIRSLYTEVTVSVEDGYDGKWQIAGGLTRDGQAHEISVAGGAWFTRVLTATEIAAGDIRGNMVQRSVDRRWKQRYLPLVKLEKSQLKLFTRPDGERALVGEISCTSLGDETVDNLALTLITPGPDRIATVNSFQHLSFRHLPNGQLEVSIEVPSHAQLRSGGRLSLMAFVGRPEAGIYRISNELLWSPSDDELGTGTGGGATLRAGGGRGG